VAQAGRGARRRAVRGRTHTRPWFACRPRVRSPPRSRSPLRAHGGRAKGAHSHFRVTPVCAAPPQANRGGPAAPLGYKGSGMPTPRLPFAARVPSPAFVAPPIARPHPPEGPVRGWGHTPPSPIARASPAGGEPQGWAAAWETTPLPSAPSPPPFTRDRGA
jgi:hypothetical protein